MSREQQEQLDTYSRLMANYTNMPYNFPPNMQYSQHPSLSGTALNATSTSNITQDPTNVPREGIGNERKFDESSVKPT